MGATTRHEYLEQMIAVLRWAGWLNVLSRYHRGLLDGQATRWDARCDDAAGKRVERWRYDVHVLD